jgi:hypothetical protein
MVRSMVWVIFHGLMEAIIKADLLITIWRVKVFTTGATEELIMEDGKIT